MFSHNVPPPSTRASCQRRPLHLTSCPRSIPPAASVLPAGSCQFIMLHPSIPDQRCSCQGFRRNDSLPGAHCECGHQACYHSHGNVAQPSPNDCAVPSMSYLALVDKIHRLEAQHEHDRRMWEEELKEERRARREDIRILREAMYPFYKFMEQDVPQKFNDVEDKIEGVVYRQQQLQERVITVDDSTMALEDRIADLENEREYERVDKNGNEDENHGHKSPQKRIDPVSDLDHSASAGTEHSPAIRGENIGVVTSDSKSTSSPPSTPTPSGRDSHPDFITSHFMSTTTPTPSDRGHVQVRSSSPRDSISDPMSRARTIIPERGSCLQSVIRGQPGIESGDDTVINSRPARTSSFNDNTLSSSPSPSPSSSPLYHAFSPSSGPFPANNRKTLKRKRYVDELQHLDTTTTTTRNRLSLPIPSPLSLSNTNADNLWCKVTDVNRAYTSSSCSSFALTH